MNRSPEVTKLERQLVDATAERIALQTELAEAWATVDVLVAEFANLRAGLEAELDAAARDRARRTLNALDGMLASLELERLSVAARCGGAHAGTVESEGLLFARATMLGWFEKGDLDGVSGPQLMQRMRAVADKAGPAARRGLPRSEAWYRAERARLRKAAAIPRPEPEMPWPPPASAVPPPREWAGSQSEWIPAKKTQE